jgi:hypothetical protein
MTTSATASGVSSRTQSRHWYYLAPVRVVVLAATLTAFALYQSARLSAFTNNDIWWHLRTGLWILENHAVPRSGLFSQSASLPWIDASWGFDVLTAFFYRHGGLSGLPVLVMCLQVMIAVALFALALSTSRKFWPAVALGAVAQFCLMPLQPRPALCSIVLLAVELTLLIRVRNAGDVRAMYWLPLVFVLWVNLDRQFPYGLLALVFFCIAVTVEQLNRQFGIAWLGNASPAIRLSSVGRAAGASFAATFVSPYTWHLYMLVWQNATSSAADRFFRELHSIRFRQPQDYAIMLLTMTAFFALGRRRSRDPFLISLLIVSALISFRMVRDNWFVVVCSVAIIGNALRDEGAIAIAGGRPLWRRNEKLAAAGLVLLLTLAASLRIPRKNNVHEGEQLLSRIEENFPLRAADYIRRNHLPQPIFNTYDWGGFLTFALPEYPVSIDGRTDLYGDDLNVAYFKLMQAEVPLQSDPGFARAQTILLEANSPIAQALVTVPDFHEVYRDKLAIVLVRSN